MGVALALLAVAAIAVAIVVLTGSNHKESATRTKHNETTSTTPDGTTSTTPDGSTRADVIRSRSIRRVLSRYVDAYSSESVSALSRLLAENLVRTNGSDPAEGRDEALDTYRRQFRGLTNPRYVLSDLRFREGAREAAASGHYTITSGAGASHGSISFHLIVVSGRGLQIDQIRIQPSA